MSIKPIPIQGKDVSYLIVSLSIRLLIKIWVDFI